jgi:hypothetical protein
MPRILAALAAFFCACAASAHITPNVELVRRGEFLRESLPGAVHYFEKQLMLSGPEGAAIRQATGWSPSEEDTRIYVGREEKGELVGTVVFLWVPSAHGPVGLCVAFAPDGVIRRAAVTDVASEPLAWVRPLIEAGAMQVVVGLAPGGALDPSRVAPAVTGSMSRYYARVIAQGVGRAQWVEQAASGRSAPR